MNTKIEPFKIKSVEPIRFTTRDQRESLLMEAGYNQFLLKAEDVIIDLLTDSGTSAMSARQWAGIMDGDESYAGSRSFYRFERVIKNITGMKHVIPTHQGRASERILFGVLGNKGAIPSNTHFDTTRANIEFNGLEAVDLLCDEGKVPEIPGDFKGNMNTLKLRRFIEDRGEENIPLCMMTVTNNSGGGQPVSMKNLKDVSGILKEHGIPFFIDACRFAENAYFIKLREKGYSDKTPLEIAREMFSLCDGLTMSAKKDAFANIGGFIALNSDQLSRKLKNLLIITEGFTTYGGLAGRDLEAIATGLEEILDQDYLKYRIESTAYLAGLLIKSGVPIIEPSGGHAVYLDAKRFCPQIRASEFPGQAICSGLYLEAGIRSAEIGSLMFGHNDSRTGEFVPAEMELVRLALPRRVYTKSHLDYIAEACSLLYQKRNELRGYRIVEEAPMLRHFTVILKPL